jgi:hypothetical protein
MDPVTEACDIEMARSATTKIGSLCVKLIVWEPHASTLLIACDHPNAVSVIPNTNHLTPCRTLWVSGILMMEHIPHPVVWSRLMLFFRLEFFFVRIRTGTLRSQSVSFQKARYQEVAPLFTIHAKDLRVDEDRIGRNSLIC